MWKWEALLKQPRCSALYLTYTETDWRAMWMWDDNERTARWRTTHSVKWWSPLSLIESQVQALPFVLGKHFHNVTNSSNSLYHFAAAVINKLIKALILMCTIPNSLRHLLISSEEIWKSRCCKWWLSKNACMNVNITAYLLLLHYVSVFLCHHKFQGNH